MVGAASNKLWKIDETDECNDEWKREKEFVANSNINSQQVALNVSKEVMESLLERVNKDSGVN